MKDIAIELLNIIHNYGYEGYIVGGFVRDMLLGIKSKDIDITTNATPMEIKNIFPSIEIPNTNYGSVTLYYRNERFEITTYREENDYKDNRHPSSILYINDLKTDLLRRDFTINTICLDKDNNIIDLLNGQNDINLHIINTIGDSDKSFQDDALRILRAVRFATILNFDLSNDIIQSIDNNRKLLRNLSYERKKRELDCIFASSRAKEGIDLLKKFGLIDVLELTNIDRVKDYSDLIGIWAMINTKTYNFNSSEKELIEKVNIVYDKNNLDNRVLYQYGLYVNILSGLNKGIDKRLILQKYENMPIKSRSDILVTAKDMCNILNKKPGSFINTIYTSLEESILTGKLVNQKEELLEYIKSNY